jgi:hypothetical protein
LCQVSIPGRLRLQAHLTARFSVTGGYYRRQFYNLQIVDNQNVTASEWNPFTIAVPTHSRLPTSGQPLPMFNLNANKVGTATDGLYTFSTANHTTNNGFEVSANLRRDKFLLFGGVTTDRRVTTSCDGSTSTRQHGARVNQIYGSVPATNAWLTPLTVMDGRYVRFGVQIEFLIL